MKIHLALKKGLSAISQDFKKMNFLCKICYICALFQLPVMLGAVAYQLNSDTLLFGYLNGLRDTILITGVSALACMMIVLATMVRDARAHQKMKMDH